MSTVGWLLRKLTSFLLAIFSAIKTVYRRVVCLGRRSRRMSGSVLPFTDQNKAVILAATATSNSVQQSVPANDTTFVQWDSWGQGPVEVPSAQRHPSQEAEPLPDVDYFGDMVPEIKRTTKILLKSRDTNSTQQSGLSSRLALKTDIPTQGSELQSWEATEGTWGQEDADLDEIAADAELAVRQKRRAQREQRHLMQQRQREEREAGRDMRTASGGGMEHMVAVRLPS